MGNKAGYLKCWNCGGADIILIPEIPYNIDNVIKSVYKRINSGKNFCIIAVAEGAFDVEGKAQERTSKDVQRLVLQLLQTELHHKFNLSRIDARVRSGHMLEVEAQCL